MLQHPLAKRIGWTILNFWIVFHFAAVCIAPASVPPATSLAQSAWQYCGGYLQMLFLNHGYHYFAPEPSGSMLISYEATTSDNALQWGRIPDGHLYPRLRYHRHLVLSEQFAGVGNAGPELKKLATEAFATEIARQRQATHVVISQVQHELSSPAQVRSGRAIDDPITYNEMWLGEFTWDAPPLRN